MATNPNVNLGSLNRVKGAVSCVDHPELNITASFLVKEGMSLSFEGETVVFLPAMTGVVLSPEPYSMVVLTLGILKTTSLGSAYKARIEQDATIGDVVVTPDSSNFPKFTINNAAIEGIEATTFNGTDPGFRIRVKGTWNTNNVLWS